MPKILTDKIAQTRLQTIIHKVRVGFWGEGIMDVVCDINKCTTHRLGAELFQNTIEAGCCSCYNRPQLHKVSKPFVVAATVATWN